MGAEADVVVLLGDAFAAVGEVEHELGGTFLQRGQGASAHALGRVPNASRVEARLDRGQVATLTTAQFAPIYLKQINRG